MKGWAFGLCSALLVSVAVQGAPPQSAPAELALVGGRLLDGYEGPPIDDAVILIAGDRITYAGPLSAVQVPAGARVVDTDGMTMLPGLIDMHVHLMILGHGVYGEWFPRYRTRMKEVMAISAAQLLDAGVTTARDVGGPLQESLWIRDEIAAGRLPGPRMRVSGPFITRQTAGLPLYFQRQVASAGEAGAVARELIEAGVDLLKPWSGMQAEDLLAVAEAARQAPRRVHLAAHGLTDEEINNAIEAGVTTLEHLGSVNSPRYDPALLGRLAGSGVSVVPTAIVSGIYTETLRFPERLDAPRLKHDFGNDIYADVRSSLARFTSLSYFWEKKRWVRHYPAKLRQLYEAGVRLLIGTDSGTPMNFHTEATWREMVWFAQAGMDPHHVIASATRLPAETLGMGADLGTIEQGKLADIIVVDGDPLHDMSEMRRVAHVIKSGRLYR